MSNSTLSFASTSTFRNALMAKNLATYKVTGVYNPPSGPKNYETVLSDSPVKDSPDTLISQDPFGQQLYPLNQYGPQGGFNLNINYNGPPLPVNSNQGEYSPNDTNMDLLNEFFIDAAYVENVYGPAGGFNNMVVVTNIQNNDKIYQPYWEPPSFVPSTYTPYDIILNDNPNGNNGSLSQDSFIAKLGASTLKKEFQERIGRLTYQNTVGLVNLESLQDPFEATLIATGKEPLIYKNWRITVPENPVGAAANFLLRVSGAYFPVSPIPGDYFNENNINGAPSQQTSIALNVVNQLTGGFLGPILNTVRNPSQIFLANTGNGQRSALFSNLNYNRYQPFLEKKIGGVIVDTLAGLINPNNNTINGSYYVGSKNSEPSTITSPPNQIPVNPFGQQVASPVYGPSELGILYEGNQNKLNFGLAAKSTIDGGGLNGQFVWTSPKYKGNAGFKATPGGGAGSRDNEFNLISSDYTKNESTTVTFKKSSILDQTQRLIEAADNVSGISRLKHVGNAINQVSKVFNDGYKEMTKGSQVVSYKDNTTGSEKGIEYCRVFAKDTPYYTFADLQKSDGIVKEGRRFANSVLDSTYNLNIVPTSTNVKKNQKGDFIAQKYMFSIENLAWRTSNKAGYTYDELPSCEKGPNGGRVMWFPPYNLKFNDTSTANWTSTPFLGRPEPIYTYRDTNRTGTLTWQIVVDSPSVLNIIVNEQLKGLSKDKINSVMDSFFAGCTKFDIYELAKKYNRIPVSELQQIQEVLNNPRLTAQEATGAIAANPSVNTVPSSGINNPVNQSKTEKSALANSLESGYTNKSFYFDNDEPKSVTSYETLYNSYIGQKNTYQIKSNGVFGSNNVLSNTNEFFTSIIEKDFTDISKGNDSFISKLSEFLKQENTQVTIELIGSSSALDSKNYNKTLSENRINSIKEYFKNYTNPNTNTSLKDLVDTRLKFIPKPKGEIANISVSGRTINCNQLITEGTGTENDKNIYSLDSMACRRVRIGKVTATEPPTNNKSNVSGPIQTNPQNDNKTINNTDNVTVSKPQSTTSISQKLKEGLSKKVLRNLLTECEYFEVMEKTTPFVYDSIKEKIKYFNPAFHSMTPEGLNARLTFLNQCVRPGQTIPVIGTDGKPKFNDASNTSFGAPPVLILRIGDFYHTKIIPESLSFTYDPLIYDMNPEGIGLQPMIANVTLSFNFIGGHGLAGPVEQLQNALSFNYYGNTEIYDERAVATEDTSALDKEVFDAIVEAQGIKSPIATNPKTNLGGTTIGNILSTNVIEGGENGDITYQAIMDKQVDQLKQYYSNVVNQADSVIKTYNYGIWQILTDQRLYSVGKLDSVPPFPSTPIFGSSEKFSNKIDELFNRFIEDIKKTDITNNNNYLMFELYKTTKFNKEIPTIENNFVKFIESLRSEFQSTVFEKNQNIVNQELELVQTFRKLNVIKEKTDGKILENTTAFIYNISGTSSVTQPTQQSDTYGELLNDYSLVALSLGKYDTFLINKLILTSTYSTLGSFTPLSQTFVVANEYDKRMFMVMARIFENKDKLEKFKDTVISSDISGTPKLRKTFDKICDDFREKVLKELKAEEKYIKDIKENKEYLDFINTNVYPKGKTRKFTYTTVPNQTTNSQQITLIKNVYSDQNVDNDNKTFNGKIKFNNN